MYDIYLDYSKSKKLMLFKTVNFLYNLSRIRR